MVDSVDPKPEEGLSEIQEAMLEAQKKDELQEEGTKMLKGRDADNALLDNIQKKGSNSYYYAHAPKDFTTEGAIHFKGDGKIYGGNPTLITTRSVEESAALRQAEEERKQKPKMKTIQKFSWADEDAKVKIYIDFAQFPGKVADDAVEVRF